MRVVGVVIRFCAAVIIACCAALYIMQHEAWFKRNAEKKVQDFFRESYDATLACELEHIDLFSPHIQLKNVRVTPLDGSSTWTWCADHATVYFSWLETIRNKCIDVHVSIQNLSAYSEVENNELAVAGHLQKLFLPPDINIPAVFKALTIQGGVLEFVDRKKDIHSTCSLHVDTKRIGKHFKANCYLRDGVITHDSRALLEHATGSILLDFQDQQTGVAYKADSSLTFDIPQLYKAPTCHMAGTWDGDHGHFMVYNTDHSLSCDPITLDASGTVSCTVRAPAYYAQQFLPFSLDDELHGQAECALTMNMHNPLATCNAQASLKTIQYKQTTLSRVDAGAWPEDDGLRGTMTIDNGDLVLSGTWHWNHEAGGKLSLFNKKKIKMPRLWDVRQNNLQMHASIDQEGTLRAHYKVLFTHHVSPSSVTCSGTIQQNGDRFYLEGKAGHDTYTMDISARPFMVHQFAYKNKKGVLAQFASQHDDPKTVEGTIDYALLHTWLPKELKKELLGTGVFRVRATQTDAGIEGVVSLDDASIRIPKLYNFIGSMHTKFVWDAQRTTLSFYDTVCKLHRGKLKAQVITLLFDEQYTMRFMHVPVLLQECFVSWQKDLYAIVSGNLLFRYYNDRPHQLSGTVFVDRSQLKGNVFSRDLQRSMLLMSEPALQHEPHDIVLDVNVLTRDPLRIKTSFIDARASFDMSLKKNVASPEASGKIEILSGELKFPYKPLSIVHGVIYVLPHQMYDPLIELTAKNKIKKYGVTLYVTGSLQNPHINFESSPTLTEEQIVALLLTGAHDSSLNILMPALIMNNIQQLIFGPAKSPSKLKRYFKSFLKPLSHVRIVPSFTDETGRGGLRAAIEIEVNDQLSAVIEKNFSLSEDVKFEVDYALSDDISLKGVQDERGDFGGEVEVKWKF